jgi:hypothetical protein
VFPRLFLTRKKHGRFVAPGPDRQNIWASRCGRRTDARLGHGVVTIHSGSFWIINTLDNMLFILLSFQLFNKKSFQLPPRNERVTIFIIYPLRFTTVCDTLHRTSPICKPIFPYKEHVKFS